MPKKKPFLPDKEIAISTPIFNELFSVAELVALKLSPIYYGYGVPHGDGSAVVIVPGLLESDAMMFEMYAWLARIGYRPYLSGLGIFADCPDRLSRILGATIDRAFSETGRPVHLIGHSLGGILARSVAVRRPEHIASVITLGAPYRGIVINGLVLAVGNAVRQGVRTLYPNLPKNCGTSRCPCSFGRSLRRRWPPSVAQTAVYSRNDGVVNWRYCLSGKPEIDVEVHGTHLGMPWNAEVYACIAERLARSQ